MKGGRESRDGKHAAESVEERAQRLHLGEGE